MGQERKFHSFSLFLNDLNVCVFFFIFRWSEGAKEHFCHPVVTFSPLVSPGGVIWNFDRPVLLPKFLTGRYFYQNFFPGGIFIRIFSRAVVFKFTGWFIFYRMVDLYIYRFKTYRGMTGYSYRSVQPVGTTKTCIFTRWTILLWWVDEKVRDYETVTKHTLYKSVTEFVFPSSIQVHPSGVLTDCLSVKHSAEPSIKFVSSMNGRMENSCLYQNRDQSRIFVNKDHEQIIYSRVETAVIASS